MTAIEIAHLKGYQNVWLESDSQLVILAFKFLSVIPWSLRNRWYNCIVRLRDMRFVVSHIYREGNACADSLANLGLCHLLSYFGLILSLISLGESTLGICWDCLISDLTPFEKVVV